MSEEEQEETLEYLKERFERFEEDDTLAKWDYEAINTMLGLIDKLQKENKELKKKTYITYINDKGEAEFIFDNYISKDKIINKINEIEENLIQTYGILGESLTTPTIKVLKELLEEN